MATENKGEIGDVYQDEEGNVLAEEREYNVGWLQISETERVRVQYTRTSHCRCTWKK